MTLKEIAQKAGVSSMTVSNVINKRYDKVSKETIEKVNNIINENHYVRNMFARTLAAKSSKIILLIVPLYSNLLKDSFYSPYISKMVGIIESELGKNGYYTMIKSTSNPDEVNEMCSRWVLDGIIVLLPDFDDNMTKLANSISIPIVCLDCYCENENILKVGCDDATGGYLSTKYLIERGHKHIGFAGDYKNSAVLFQRFQGYKKALTESGITLDNTNIFELPPDYENGLIIGNLISAVNNKNRVTSIVTCSDMSAIGVIESLHNNKINVPDEISVIGFDNLPICNYITPKLTSVCQELTTKAKSAVSILLDGINGINAKNKISVNVSIVERGSVATI